MSRPRLGTAPSCAPLRPGAAAIAASEGWPPTACGRVGGAKGLQKGFYSSYPFQPSLREWLQVDQQAMHQALNQLNMKSHTGKCPPCGRLLYQFREALEDPSFEA